MSGMRALGGQRKCTFCACSVRRELSLPAIVASSATAACLAASLSFRDLEKIAAALEAVETGLSPGLPPEAIATVLGDSVERGGANGLGDPPPPPLRHVPLCGGMLDGLIMATGEKGGASAMRVRTVVGACSLSVNIA